MRKEGERGYGKTHRWRREEQRVKIIPDLNRRDEDVGFVCSNSLKHQENLRTVCQAHMPFGERNGTPPPTPPQQKKGVLQPGKTGILVALGSICDKGDK